jgi:hypothetical protein
VGAFGITAAPDLLTVRDVVMVPQQCNCAFVSFDDEGVSEFFEDQVELGRKPQEFGRIWIHTHPCNSATPSGTDETTFERCFGASDWSVMFILAEGGQKYCRLQTTVPVLQTTKLKSEVDWSTEYPAATQSDWLSEYETNVTEDVAHWQNTVNGFGGKAVANIAACGAGQKTEDELMIERWAEMKDYQKRWADVDND